MTDDDRRRIIEDNRKLVKGWRPGPVFGYFAELCAIPHGSGNTDAMGAFLGNFAVRHGLASHRDGTGNIIIGKPAQNSTAVEGVILQAHQDMVCVKAAGKSHDFDRDPIELVKVCEHNCEELAANGTTLGADDAIGVALALAVLADREIAHPPLEALFTVDEETDMKGAKAVDPVLLKGKILINLDAEELGVAYVSCAAGVLSELRLPVATTENAFPDAAYHIIRVEGLLGGHSGVDINSARANAYVLLARFLRAAGRKIDMTLHTFEQGENYGADNVIPDRARALVAVRSAEAAEQLEALAKTWERTFRREYRSSDPGCKVIVERAEPAERTFPPLTPQCRDTLLNVVTLLPLGVFRFIQRADLLGGDLAYRDLLVETSCNLGIARIAGGIITMRLLTRSSTASVLEDILERIGGLARMAGGTLVEDNRTPGWEMPAEPTPIQRLFGERGLACVGLHAGLECGCLVDLFKEQGRSLDAVSIGPDVRDAHSPKERLGIHSVQTLWEQLTTVLAKI